MDTQMLIQISFFMGASWVVFDKIQILKMAAAATGGSRPITGPKPPKVIAPVKVNDKKKSRWSSRTATNSFSSAIVFLPALIVLGILSQK